jgi:glyoxylase-like metal-dependent hydrolase (beta-lactamase superfamily II)
LTRPRLDRAQTALAQVTRLGFTADDVRHVVVTHLDPDHAGGLGDFPRATVHLHRPEHLALTAPGTLAERVRYLRRQFAHEPRWRAYDLDGERWLGLPSVRVLDGVRDEIALVPLPGHTRGHSGVAIKDGARWLLHAGDAYFHRGELDGGAVPIGLRALATFDEHDRDARLASVSSLRGLARRDDVTIVCSHDRRELRDVNEASITDRPSAVV